MNIGLWIFLVVFGFGFIAGSLITFAFSWWYSSDVNFDDEDYT